jgi:acetolactate synthase-1/2/3 large subunit
MNSQELEVARRLKLNLVVMVLNDGSYGMIRWKQQLAGFDDWGLEFNNPDFVRYAESYGISGHRIESTEDLVPVLDKAFESGGVHLVDVPIDYSQNTKVLIDQLAEKVCVL